MVTVVHIGTNSVVTPWHEETTDAEKFERLDVIDSGNNGLSLVK
jgi:hypothetical protein